MTISTNNFSAEINMNGRKLKDVTSFNYLGASCVRMAMLSRNPHQDCLSNGSVGQLKQDLAK